MEVKEVKQPVAGSGIPGLDTILGGGFPRDHVYLLQGDPGAGKTTLSLQFLLEGARQGETALYVTLSETKRELETVAISHGWSLDPVHVYEHLVREDALGSDDDETTIFHPSEVELGQTVTAILKEVERINPSRLVLDSLSEIRLLSENTLRYRRQILALKQYFANRGTTALFLDDRTSESNDLQLHSVPHGVLVLERRAPLYGAARRRMEVVKLRGVDFRGGYHDFIIRRGGIEVFPRLIAERHDEQSQSAQLTSGIREIDALLGGGIDAGSSTLIMGPAGAGKSTLATQYALAAAKRGDNVALFIFDESKKTFFARSEALSLDLTAPDVRRLITVQQVDPAELAPGEFAQLVRDAVEKRNARVLVIDSLNGYLNAMPEERFLTLHLHELLTYLGDRGVATILVMAQHGLIGSNMVTSVDVSYLADCVVLLRYYESDGELHKAISVMKKRSGEHEKAIRDFSMSSSGGIHVGPPLKRFRGILSGIPVITNEAAG